MRLNQTGVTAAIALCAVLAGCDSGKKTTDIPDSAPTPQVTVETRPANRGQATRADHEGAVELMLANANVPASQVEEYARRNGITIDPSRMEAKRNAERAMQGRPKLVAGEEYLAADPAAGQAMPGPAARPRVDDGGPTS